MNKNKFKIILLLFTLFVFFNNINVYANDNECIYDEILKIKYDPSSDKLTYEEIKPTTTCGTIDNPCKVLNKVYELTDILTSNLDKEWKKIFVVDGTFTCPQLYYSYTKDESPMNGDWTYQYDFSPVTPAKIVVTDLIAYRKFDKEKDKLSPVDIRTSDCSADVIQSFEEYYNDQLSTFKQHVDIYITEIKQNQNINYNEFSTISTEYTEKLKTKLSTHTDNIKERYNSLQCTYPYTYSYILSRKWAPNTTDITSKFYLAIDETAVINYSNGTINESQFEYIHEKAYEKVEVSATNKSAIDNNDTLDIDNNISVDWGNPILLECEGILGNDLLDFFNKIFKWIRIIAPIAVIILSSVDFAGAVLQDDKDAMKKATNKFVRRLIVAVALFFIPLILEFILNVFNQVTGSNSGICGIGR